MNVAISPHQIGLRRRLYLALQNMDVMGASWVFDQGLDADTRFNLNSYQVPAISISAEHNDVPMVQLLISMGASINQKGNGGRTPLSAACYFNFIELAELLIRHNADVNAQDADGCTPLFQACLRGHFGLVEQILDAGADVNLVNHHEQTALHAATCSGNLNIVETVVRHGVNVKWVDVHGRNCLHHAARVRNPNVHVVKFLCQQVPSAIFQPDNVGDNPLHMLVCKQDRGTECLKAILSLAPITLHNASKLLSARGNVGHTHLHTAVTLGYYEGVRLLLAAGADVNACDTFGYTPLDSSFRSRKNLRLVSLLLSAGAKTSCRHVLRDNCDENTSSLVQNGLRNPLKLKASCRIVLVSLYGPSLETIGKLIPLPESLRKYLMFLS